MRSLQGVRGGVEVAAEPLSRAARRRLRRSRQPRLPIARPAAAERPVLRAGHTEKPARTHARGRRAHAWREAHCVGAAAGASTARGQNAGRRSDPRSSRVADQAPGGVWKNFVGSPVNELPSLNKEGAPRSLVAWCMRLPRVVHALPTPFGSFCMSSMLPTDGVRQSGSSDLYPCPLPYPWSCGKPPRGGGTHEVDGHRAGRGSYGLTFAFLP